MRDDKFTVLKQKKKKPFCILFAFHHRNANAPDVMTVPPSSPVAFTFQVPSTLQQCNAMPCHAMPPRRDKTHAAVSCLPPRRCTS